MYIYMMIPTTSKRGRQTIATKEDPDKRHKRKPRKTI